VAFTALRVTNTIRGVLSAPFVSLLYHHLIYELVLLSDGAPFQSCEASLLAKGIYSESTAAACLHMVCTCSSIRTVAITISSKSSYADLDCDCSGRRAIPLWRLCTQPCKQRSICILNTGFLCNSLANHRRGSHPTSRTRCRAHRHCTFDLWRDNEFFQ